MPRICCQIAPRLPNTSHAHTHRHTHTHTHIFAHTLTKLVYVYGLCPKGRVRVFVY